MIRLGSWIARKELPPTPSELAGGLFFPEIKAVTSWAKRLLVIPSDSFIN